MQVCKRCHHVVTEFGLDMKLIIPPPYGGVYFLHFLNRDLPSIVLPLEPAFPHFSPKHAIIW